MYFIVQTIASIKLPKAKEPKWYLKALHTERVIGLCGPESEFTEKYQMQTELARTNCPRAIKNALVQRIPQNSK